jgi:ArsR family metal-binding transcriptional regulator
MDDDLVTDEEMEHYLMFPDLYCKGCEGGCGPLCIDCLNKEIDLDGTHLDYEGEW